MKTLSGIFIRIGKMHTPGGLALQNREKEILAGELTIFLFLKGLISL